MPQRTRSEYVTKGMKLFVHVKMVWLLLLDNSVISEDQCTSVCKPLTLLQVSLVEQENNQTNLYIAPRVTQQVPLVYLHLNNGWESNHGD